MHIATLLLMLSGPGQDSMAIDPNASNSRNAIVRAQWGESFGADPPGFETLAGMITTEWESVDMVERYIWLHEHPLDLNRLTAEELEALPGVTPLDASLIVRRRNESGPFASVDAVGNQNDDLAERLRPFVYVADTSGPVQDQRHIRMRSRAARSYLTRTAAAESTYLGSPYKYLGRMDFSLSRHVDCGFQFKKDAGEMLRYASVGGFLHVHDLAFISRMVVGDFTMEAGEGLVLGRQGWASRPFGRTTSSMKDPPGLHAYHQTNESGAFRGIAFSTQTGTPAGQLGITLFWSRRWLNAVVDDRGKITSFSSDDLFRTTAELGKRAVANERTVGGRAEFASQPGFVYGLTYCASRFQPPVAEAKPFAFAGPGVEMFGVDVHYRCAVGSLGMEIARASGQGSALTAQASVLMGSSATFTVGFHTLSPGFVSFHGANPVIGGEADNEKRVSMGASMTIFRWLQVESTVDQYRSRWRTYDDPVPVQGERAQLSLKAHLLRNLPLTFSYTRKREETTKVNRIVEQVEHKLRLGISFRLNKRLAISTRIAFTNQGIRATRVSERGMYIAHELHCEILRGLSVEGNITLFETGSYTTRVFAYEPDLGSAVGGAMLYGRGRRWCLALGSHFWNHLVVSGKIAGMNKTTPLVLEDASGGESERTMGLQLDWEY